MIKFKYEQDKKRYSELHPLLQMIFATTWWYAYTELGVELVITQTHTTKFQDDSIGRVSDAHRTKRAIDIRTKNLRPDQIQKIMDYINENPSWEEYKYTSFSGEERLAFWHKGTAEHIHLAIHKKYSL